MSRRLARESLYQLVFEYTFTKEKDDTALELICHDSSLDEDDVAYIRRVYSGIIDNYASILDVIKSKAHGFTVERIFKADLSALILAIYEIEHEDDIPPLVSLNESLDIVKKYSTDKSNSYVHGILASILKDKGI